MPNANILFQNIPSATPQEAMQGVLQNQAALNQFQQQPMRNALLQSQVEGAQLRNQGAQQQLDADTARMQLGDMASDAIQIKPLLESGNTTRANVLLAERIQKILQRGGDPSDTIAFRDALNGGQITPQQAAAELDGVISAAERAGALNRNPGGSAMAEFQGKAAAAGLVPGTPEYRQAALVDMGLAARAGTVTGQERIATTPGMTDVVADSESTIEGAKSGAKEAAKLGVQAKMSPDIERAVTLAKETAKQQADQVGQEKTNAKAMKIYDSAINNLFDALGSTTTGVWAGWAPALTDNARAAEGAIAVMAPVLKEMFRVSGEGTFTKDDQDRLMAMLPSRSDSPPVRAAKLDAVDLVVRAKLSQGESKQTFKEKMTGETDPPKEGGQLMIDANGNRAMVYPDGSFEEIP